MQVEPRPGRMARVFVGRVEVLTPEVKRIVTTAVAKNDRATLEKYGRFLQPILHDAGYNAVSQTVQQVFEKYMRLENGCGKSTDW